MRFYTPLILFQFILSVVSAYLLSQMSWMGKLGISVFYKEYSILKNPLQSGIMIFGLEILVILILGIIHKFSSKKVVVSVAIILFLLALVGLLYSYSDFSENFSHKILKQKFHLGVYLIWIGIMVSCAFFILKPKRKQIK